MVTIFKQPSLIIISLVAYFLILLYIGFKSKNQNKQEFIIGSRQVGILPTIGSLASGFRDGAGLILWMGMAFSIGYGGLWIIFGIMLGLILLALIGKKVRNIAEKKDFITVGDMVASNVGTITEKVISLIVLIFSALYIAIQIFIISNLFERILNISPIWGASITVFVVGFYVMIGGYSTVVKTDVFQFFLVISLLVVPFFLHPSVSDIKKVETLFSLPLFDRIGMFGMGFFYVFSGAEIWQRIFSSKNSKVISISFPASALFLLIMTITLIFIGYGAKNIIDTNTLPNDVFFTLFESNFISKYLLAFIGVAVIAISMSTLDTFAYLFSSTFLQNIKKKYNNSQKQYVLSTRITIFILLILMSILALTISDIIQFLFNSVSLMFIISPILVFSALDFFKPSLKLDLFISTILIICVSIYVYMLTNNLFENFMMNLIPAILSLFLTTITLIKKNKKKNHG